MREPLSDLHQQVPYAAESFLPRSSPQLMILLGHAWTVISLSFSADGTLLASADVYSSVRIWDVVQGSQVALIPVDVVSGVAALCTNMLLVTPTFPAGH